MDVWRGVWKLNFSALYEGYHAMKNPAYRLKVGGTEIRTGERAVLERLDCEMTCRNEAGYLLVQGVLNPDEKEGKSWLDAFQAGTECELSLGYDKDLKKVFTGFLYEVSWSDPLEDGAMELQALFLDARGRLMTSSCADAGAARTLSQMVKTILTQSYVKKLASSQKISPAPKDWDLPVQRPGDSDYQVVCEAAEFLCYEFYVCGEELYFGEPRPDSSPIVTFDGVTGLTRLRRSRTLASQCAAVTVSGTDDKGERIQARQARKKDSGFGTDRMASALSNDIHIPEETVRTMAQAKYLAQARMEQRQHQAGKLEGTCLGTPELRPGRFIKTEKCSKPVCGTFYVHTVRHRLSSSGYLTEFEAEE